MSKKTEFSSYKEMPIRPMTIADMLWNETGSWRNVRPVYSRTVSPCIQGCPTSENIQHYIQLILDRDYQAAWETIIETNPMPAVTGRVCYHPCMTKCTRSDYDESINIISLERALGDKGLENPGWMKKSKAVRDEKVAVVGGGPAGLSCAFYLARAGYPVTLFEADSELGGVLRWGIPEYRLPNDILDKVINIIVESGPIEVMTGVQVGADKALEELEDEFDAVFLGIGLSSSRELGLDNEDCEGVGKGLDFLREVNSGGNPEVGEKVAVIGGGNTAMDVARCALRLGGEVTVVYRRTLAEMPAITDEIEEAREEGVKFEYLASPKEIIAKEGKLSKVVFQKMELGEPDESGRRRPVPVEGEEFTMEVDHLFTAIGEVSDLEGFEEALDTSWNLLEVSDEYGRTSKEGFFAGGDIVTGAASVVEAIAAGRKSAEKIDRVFRGIDDPVEEEYEEFGIEKINTDYFPKLKQNSQPRILPGKARKDFSEIMNGYNEDLIQKEAERCFSCGVCNYCDNCWIFCPDTAIIRREDEYEINYDYCKGCLVCVQECPRNVFVIEEE